jgi:hypothetical protein
MGSTEDRLLSSENMYLVSSGDPQISSGDLGRPSEDGHIPKKGIHGASSEVTEISPSGIGRPSADISTILSGCRSNLGGPKNRNYRVSTAPSISL